MPNPAGPPLALSPCPGYGFDYAATTPEDALHVQRDGTPSAIGRLQAGGALLRRRPAAGVWSPLEYGAHLRDVLAAQRERVVQALLEDAPHFAPLHRDERASLLRYNDDDPQQVAAALALGAGLLERLGADLTTAQLRRSCVYDLPEPTPVTVGWVFVHTAHEMCHHLLDIEHGLSEPQGRAG